MPQKTKTHDDFSLSYPEVQKLLGKSRRHVQKLVAEGVLEKNMIQGPNGKQAFFSKTQVETLGGGVKQGDEQPEAKLIRYETGISFFQKMITEREGTIAKQHEEIKQLTESKGKLEGALEVYKQQIEEQNSLEEEVGKLRQETNAQPLIALTWVIVAFFAGFVLTLVLHDRLVALIAR